MKEKNIYKTAIEGAKWWANKLKNGCVQNNNPDSRESEMAMILLTILTMQSRISEEQADKMADALAKIIDERLKATGTCYLDVDYHPCSELYDAAVQAGIKGAQFPVKTTMIITPTEVKAGSVYGELEVIYQEKTEENKSEDNTDGTGDNI